MRAHSLLVLLVPAVLQAQTGRDSTISVNATRSVRIAPDRASMYVIVEGTAETPSDAVTRVETKLKAVSDALKALGPRAEVERSMVYSVGPNTQPNVYPQSTGPTTNIARALIRVQTNRADQIAQITAAALTAGATGVSGITFESSVADSVRRARTAEALASARAEAQAIAASMDAKLGALVEVITTNQNIGFTAQSQFLTVDARFSQPPQAPDVTISSTVTVRYRLTK